MQPGTIVQGQKNTYTVQAAIGEPGLYGIAYRAVAPDGAAVVIKALRADRPLEDKDRVVAEAETLRRVAAAEDARQAHYAVRLIDESPPASMPPFIVLELATGQNVLNDLVGRVMDWEHAPLAEATVLTIAREFAEALRLAHAAGLCYDDMKLDNLFWDAERPDGHPLRIIDWNVVSDVQTRGVGGDWARFGARLYELLTGRYIGISREGDVEGSPERSARWQALPYGLRSIIERALNPQPHLRYQADDEMIADLEREIDLRVQPIDELLRRIRVAAGGKQWTVALAAIDRARRLLDAQDRPDDATQAQLAQLQTEVEYGVGRARGGELESGKRLLSRNEYGLAVERLRAVCTSVQGRDPRARWWLWLAETAHEQGSKWYASLRDELEAGVNALEQDEFPLAAKAFGLVSRQTHLPLIKALGAEALARSKAAKLLADAPGLALDERILRLGDVLEKLGELKELFAQYADLNDWYADLQSQLRLLERQRDRGEKLNRQLAAVEKQVGLGDADYARQRWEPALATYAAARASYAELLGDHLSPTQAAQAQAMLDRIDLHALVAQIELGLAQDAPLGEVEGLVAQLPFQRLPADTAQALQQRLQARRAQAAAARDQAILGARETLHRLHQRLNQAIAHFDQAAVDTVGAELAALQAYGDQELGRQIAVTRQRTAGLASELAAAAAPYQAALDSERQGDDDAAQAAYQRAAQAAPSLAWLADKAAASASTIQLKAELAGIQQLVRRATDQADLAGLRTTQRLLGALTPPAGAPVAAAIAATQQQIQSLLAEIEAAAAALADLDRSDPAALSLGALGANHRALIRARESAPAIALYGDQARQAAEAIIARLTSEHGRLSAEFEACRYTPAGEALQAISAQASAIINAYPLGQRSAAADRSWERPDDLAELRQSFEALLAAVSATIIAENKRQHDLSQHLKAAEVMLLRGTYADAIGAVASALELAQSQSEIDQVGALRQRIEHKQADERAQIEEQSNLLRQIEEQLARANHAQAALLLQQVESHDLHASLQPRLSQLSAQAAAAAAAMPAPAVAEAVRELDWTSAIAPLSTIDGRRFHILDGANLASIQPTIDALLEAKTRLAMLVAHGRGSYEVNTIAKFVDHLQLYQAMLQRQPGDIAAFQPLIDSLPGIKEVRKRIPENNFTEAIKETLSQIAATLAAIPQTAQVVAALRQAVAGRAADDTAAQNAVRYQQAHDLCTILADPAVRALDPELGSATRFLEFEQLQLAALARDIEGQWRSDAAIQRYERETELWIAAFAVAAAQDRLRELVAAPADGPALVPGPAGNGHAFWSLVRQISSQQDAFKAAVDAKVKWHREKKSLESAAPEEDQWRQLAQDLARLFSSPPIKALDAEVRRQTGFLKHELVQLGELRNSLVQRWVAQAHGDFRGVAQLLPIAVAILEAEHHLPEPERAAILEVEQQQAGPDRSVLPPPGQPTLSLAIEMLAQGRADQTLWALAALPPAERGQFNKQREEYANQLFAKARRSAVREQRIYVKKES